MIKRWIMTVALFVTFAGSVYASENVISTIAGTIYITETVEKVNQINSQDTFHMRFNAKEMLLVGSEKPVEVPDCFFEGEGKIDKTTERIVVKFMRMTCGNHQPIKVDAFVVDVNKLAGLNAQKRKKWWVFGETVFTLPKGTMAGVILK